MASLTPAQNETLVTLGAVTVETPDSGQILAVDQQLQKWRINGEGHPEKDGEAPSLGLPDDFEPGFAESSADLTDVIVELKRPMTPAAVKWKVQTALGSPADPWGALIVPYIDQRLATGRLNTVIPGDWYEGVPGPDGRPDPTVPGFELVDWGYGGTMLCRLTVCGRTHIDVGNGGSDGKAMVSDSLKRAAVKFGIGAFLYAIPKVTFKKAQMRWTDGKDKKDRPIKRPWLTEEGEAWLPLLYTRWLHEHGMQAFGAPLDHGDTVGAGGDVEALDPEAVAEEGVEAEEDKEPTEEQKQRGELGAAVVKKGGKG
jgi:hypothetical protein